MFNQCDKDYRYGCVSVTICPKDVEIRKGCYNIFSAKVEPYRTPYKSVVWEICEPTAQSFISETGVLSVGINESYKVLHIKCTSAVDLETYDIVTVSII